MQSTQKWVRFRIAVTCTLAAFALGACGDDAAQDGGVPMDALPGDVSDGDASTDDGGATDGSLVDGGPALPDVGAPDSAAPDSAAPDSAAPDAGLPMGCDFGGRPPIDDSPLAHRSGRTETHRVGTFTDEYLWDASSTSKIGIRREWGSSVVFFGRVGDGPGSNGTNTIDANDTGREVQVALYDPDRTRQGCSWNGSCAAMPTCSMSIRHLGWNPVQGGNRCNLGSPTESVSRPVGALVATTVPLQWNPDWDARDCATDSCGAGATTPSDVRLTQSIRFVAPQVAEVRYAVENLTDIARAPAQQEMPTLYTANGNEGPDLWRLMDPSGAQIAIDTPSAGDGFFYENFTSTAPWITLQNDDLSYGVAILYENGLQDFQAWQQRDLPFNNVRSRIVFGVPARAVVQARAYLIYGSFAEIRTEAERLIRTLPPFGTLDLPGTEVGRGEQMLSGWALDNRGVVSVEARIDGSEVVPLTFGIARPDVCAAWPGYPDCETGVGFSGRYDFGAPQMCPHLVEVIATDGDGNRRTIAERLVFVR